jgi:hypothetical protein
MTSSLLAAAAAETLRAVMAVANRHKIGFGSSATSPSVSISVEE